ncbi:MAG: DUF2934 domain-containing protein [Terracidiphilus sp.]
MIVSNLPKRTKPSETKPAAVAAKTAAPRKAATQATRVPSDTIQMRAYQIFASRGYEHGHDVQDWLRAERQIQMPAQ